VITATKIEKVLQTGAAHVLYREDGLWYHHLKHFPGVLFDKGGLIRFESKREYLSNKSLQHKKDLHVIGGISTIEGYIKFSKSELKMIGQLKNGLASVIDEVDAWKIFIKNAQLYKQRREVFISTSRNRKYQITSTDNDVVRVERLNTHDSFETIGRAKFKTCVRRINDLGFPIKVRSIYEHVAEETTIVELLPMLDWSEDFKYVVFTDQFYNENNQKRPEAKNDNIDDRVFRLLQIRRGQKKLREKLFELYSGRCIVSNCDIKEVLHACHVTEFAISGNNISTNAVLLRSDIHDLFDSGLLAINPKTMRIAVHSSLQKTEYFQFNDKPILKRLDKKEIDEDALIIRWKVFKTLPRS